jgi:hypothetical protein
MAGVMGMEPFSPLSSQFPIKSAARPAGNTANARMAPARFGNAVRYVIATSCRVVSEIVIVAVSA